MIFFFSFQYILLVDLIISTYPVLGYVGAYPSCHIMGGRLHHALVTSLLQLLHCRHRSSTSCSAVVLNILLHFVPVYHRLADHPWRTLNCTNLHDCCDTKTINCFINPLFPQRYYDIICVLISNCPLTVAPWRGCWRFTLKNDALWLTEQLNCVTLDSLRFNCHNSDRAGLLWYYVQFAEFNSSILQESLLTTVILFIGEVMSCMF